MRWLARRVAGRLPSVVLLLGLAVAGLARLVVALARRPWLGLPILTVAFCWWVIARFGGVAVIVVVLLVLGLVVVPFAVACYVQPATWQATVDAVRSWRRHRHYAARWLEAVEGCGLVRRGVEPVLMSVRSSGGVDRLAVHPAPGSIPADWRDVADRLASALEVRSIRVRRDGVRDVVLLARWREIRWHDPEVGDDAAVDAEVAETVEQHGPFPRAPR